MNYEVGDYVELTDDESRYKNWIGVRGIIEGVKKYDFIIKIVSTKHDLKTHTIGDIVNVTGPIRKINTTIPEYLKNNEI